MSAPVRAEPDGDVLVITIDRPEARNAVNLAVAEGIAAAVDRLDGDDSLRAGVLTGAGGTFCAGMDLKAFVAGERPFVSGREFAGGGFEVALACDLIVSRVTDPGRAVVGARELAAQIARNGPLAVFGSTTPAREPPRAQRSASRSGAAGRRTSTAQVRGGGGSAE